MRSISQMFIVIFAPQLKISMNEYLIYAFGFIAPVLFFARTFIQWYKSEQNTKVTSPTLYWKISLAGSTVLLVYGIMRNDFAIVLGQFIVYPVYIRNLQLKNVWQNMQLLTRITVILLPLLCLGWLFFSETNNFYSIVNNENVSFILMFWGSFAQVVFTARFLYQWYYSENRKESVLPLGFWIISIAGSLMILTYAVLRADPVFFAAHILGLFMYIRNIFLHFNKKSIFQLLMPKAKN